MYGFKEPEALRHIEERLGRPIRHAHYWRVRKFLESESSNNLWLNNQARSAFIFRLQTRIAIADRMVQSTFQRLLEEDRKSPAGCMHDSSLATRNDGLIIALKKELRDEIELTHELDGCIPIAAKLKSLILAKESPPKREKGMPLDKGLMDELWRSVQMEEEK